MATEGNLTGIASWYPFVNNPCNWTGVHCNAQDSIIKLILPSMRLKGSIPSSISHLLELEEINLASNFLNGTIPESFYDLANLGITNILIVTNLLRYVNGNKFNGTIPSNIDMLVSLTHLSFYNNELSGSIPSSIGKLSQLQILNFGANFLSGSIPTTIGKLSTLHELSLSNNAYLTGTIPTQMGDLSISSLDVSSTSLLGIIPSQLGNLVNLLSLYLQNCNFSSPLPSSLASLPKLENFFVTGNSNICETCFKFNIRVPFCGYDKGLNCNCNYIVCNSSSCPTCPKSIPCAGFYLGLGSCNGSTLIINVTSWNERTSISLIHVSSFLAGDAKIYAVDATNSSIIIQGTLSGLNSTLSLSNTLLQISSLFHLENSKIIMDINSNISVGAANLKDTILTLNLPPDTNNITYYPTIIFNHLDCQKVLQIQKSNSISVTIVSKDMSCYNSNMNGMIIGIVFGVLLVIVLIIGGIIFYKNKMDNDKELGNLAVNS